jgi:uncharacterized lipoprotein YmbA
MRGKLKTMRIAIRLVVVALLAGGCASTSPTTHTLGLRYAPGVQAQEAQDAGGADRRR